LVGQIPGELCHADEIDRSGFGDRTGRYVALAGFGGKTREEHNGRNRRVRPVLRTLYFRLRSVQLVRRVYVHQRSIDTGAVLALLSAERALSGAALLRAIARSSHTTMSKNFSVQRARNW
jgi:hypothetical protein